MAHVVEGGSYRTTGFTGLTNNLSKLAEKKKAAEAKLMNLADLNKDGKITPEEKAEYAKRIDICNMMDEYQRTKKALEEPIKESKPKFSSEF